MAESHAEITRRLRYQLGRAEDALDVASAALYRARELLAIDPTTREEAESDLASVRSKLGMLRNILQSGFTDR